MASEAVQEELEVLTSILDEDFQQISNDEVSIRIEAEEGTSLDPPVLSLIVKYTETYPDETPVLALQILEAGAEEDAITAEEQERLLGRLREIAEENLGIAMVYTLVMQLKESLTELLVSKAATREMEDQAEQLKIQEAELAAPKGTPVTKENFLTWRKRFDVDMKLLKEQQQREDLRFLQPKERKERETFISRLTGRQIFETKRSTGDDEEDEEGAQLIDLSKYDRQEQADIDEQDDEADNGIIYSDSD